MCLRSLEIFEFFQRGDRLYASESDVYRRQILTHKDGPRAGRVKLQLTVSKNMIIFLSM